MSFDARIVAAARGWLGTPYQHQASVKGVGCDCLGLLRGVWREIYGFEPALPPPYSPDWAEAGGVESLRQAAMFYLVPKPHLELSLGSVLLFRWRNHLPAKHCAIVTAPDQMIHAHDGASVVEVAIRPWWRRHISDVFRFPA
jgi:NlpC/P60 family putative phage cell wall peptidase